MTPIQGPNFIFFAVTSQNEAKKPWLPLVQYVGNWYRAWDFDKRFHV